MATKEKKLDLNKAIRSIADSAFEKQEKPQLQLTGGSESVLDRASKATRRAAKQGKLGIKAQKQSLNLKEIKGDRSELKRLSKIQRSSEKLIKDVAKNENVQLDQEGLSDAALAFLPVIVGGLLGGAEGALAGVQAGAIGIQAREKAKAAKAKGALDERQVEVQESEAATKARKVELDAKNDAARIAAAGSGEKPLTESQSKSRIFGARAAQAEKEFEDIFATFDPTAIQQSAQSLLPRRLQSDEFQRFEQGKNNFLLAILRKESGARISDEEIAVGDLQYFPQTGDGKAVVAQKARNRSLVTNLLLEEGKININDPRIQRNFVKTSRLKQIQAEKIRRGL